MTGPEDHTLNVTLDELKSALAHERIEQRRTQNVSRTLLGRQRCEDWHEFLILPPDGRGPALSLLFGVHGGDYTLQHLGFGEWHGHFERHGDERRNVDDALNLVRRIIADELCLLVTRDDRGRYAAGEIVDTASAAARAGEDANLQVLKFNR